MARRLACRSSRTAASYVSDSEDELNEAMDTVAWSVLEPVLEEEDDDDDEDDDNDKEEVEELSSEWLS